MPRQGKAAELALWLEQHQPARIGIDEFSALRTALAPVSDSYLRKLVRDCGVPLDAMVAGVRQGNLDELQASLALLLDQYLSGDAAHKREVRRLVITAKEHARLAARNPARQAEKAEVILWLTTWLENPPLFPDWVALRRGLLLH